MEGVKLLRTGRRGPRKGNKTEELLLLSNACESGDLAAVKELLPKGMHQRLAVRILILVLLVILEHELYIGS